MRDTSQKAFEELDSAPLLKRAFEVIYEGGVEGATADEVTVAAADGRQYHQRPGELEKKGYIVDSGRRRKTRFGKDAIVWIAKEFQADIGSQQEMAL